ncbi:MAG: hypothetical protein WDM85_18620 [Caulobacteraceae bacterium]
MPFDVALIDGPITASFGAATRSVPLDWCVARIAPDGAVYLDDADRVEERMVVDGSRAAWPGMEVDRLHAEKGLVRLRRSDLIVSEAHS